MRGRRFDRANLARFLLCGGVARLCADQNAFSVRVAQAVRRRRIWRTEVLDRIAIEAPSWLAPGGWVACEIGETQGLHVSRAFSTLLDSVEVRRDLTGRDRFVIGRRS